MLKTFPKTHITLAAAATIVVSAAVLMSPSADVEAKRMSYTIDLEEGLVSGVAPKDTSSGQGQEANDTPSQGDKVESTGQSIAQAGRPAKPEAPKVDWQEFRVKSGDTLSSLFRKAGFNDGIMLSVIHGEGEAGKLQRLYAGEDIRFGVDADGQLVAVELQRSRLETLKISKGENGFRGQTQVRKPEPRPAFAAGVIDGSLYLAARDAGLNDRLTMELAGIFGWDIDFVYDVRKGDSFEVVYEELYIDGEKFDTGRILSARFINRAPRMWPCCIQTTTATVTITRRKAKACARRS